MQPTLDLQQTQSHHIAFWARLYAALIVCLLVLVVGRVVQLKLAPSSLLATSSGSTTSQRNEIARRGNMLDRNQRIIATDSVGYRLFIDPMEVEDVTTIAVDVAAMIDDDPVRIDREIAKRPDSRYVVVSHLLEDWQVEAMQRAKFRGVGLEPRLVRHYPQGEIAASLVGMVGFEHSGLGGVEHAFDSTLQPATGRLTYLRDARRRALWIEPQGYRPAQDGRDVHLSIDLVIQEIAETRIRDAVKQYNAGGGRLLVVDCKTGEILAMCDVLNQRRGRDQFAHDPGRELHPSLGRNRCVTDPYEPGSTFKPFVWAVATEMKKASPDEVLPCPDHTGWRTSQGRLIRDSHYYGPSTWKKVLVKSMNSGMAIIAERMSSREMQEAIARYGFGHRTYCGISGESPGIVTTPGQWSHYTQTSVCMGHEIAVTPLQMARAFCAFARDGTLPTLRITAARPWNQEYRMIHRVLSSSLAYTVRDAMRDVMVEGTGRRAQSELYEIFGKSGTAQLPKPNGGGYYEDRYVSSFIAGAPFDDPQIVVLCVIDDPDKSINHWGGAIAGPVVRDVIDETLQYLGIPPDKPQPHQPDTSRQVAMAR